MEDELTNYQNGQENIPETKINLKKTEQNSKEEFKEDSPIKVKIDRVNANKLSQESIQNLTLNIKIYNFLKILDSYNKLKIFCYKTKCSIGFRSSRSYQVIGINNKDEENLIMTASQEELHSNSYGYMLVYKYNNIIFGTLGYQINYKEKCECFKGCCTCSCKKCNICCLDCYEMGGCCKGGCCTEQGCCCFCEDGCCIDGCCPFCNCCCFEDGCCKEPCCKNGCCPCPDYEKILLDVRFLNTMKEALNKQAGFYVSTLYSPVKCLGIIPTYIGYKKCGERFALDDKCCSCNGIHLNIIDLEKGENVGRVRQNKMCSFDVKSYFVNLPKYAHPLEKLLIISEIFMFVYLNWDEKRKDKIIVTKKRNIFPGLEPNFC